MSRRGLAVLVVTLLGGLLLLPACPNPPKPVSEPVPEPVYAPHPQGGVKPTPPRPEVGGAGSSTRPVPVEEPVRIEEETRTETHLIEEGPMEPD